MIDGDKATNSLAWILVYIILACVGVFLVAGLALSLLELFLKLVLLALVAFIIWAGWSVVHGR